MKEYEKLALEAIKHIPEKEEYIRKMCEMSFQNGFLEARSMIAGNPPVEGALDEFGFYCAVMALGEKEV